MDCQERTLARSIDLWDERQVSVLVSPLLRFNAFASQQENQPYKGIPPFLMLFVPGNPDTRARTQRLEAVLREADVPATASGKRDSNHSRLNNDLGKVDDPAREEFHKFLDPLVGRK